MTTLSLLQSGNEAYVDEKFDDAFDLYTAALAANDGTANESDVLLKRSQCQLKRGKAADALADAEAAIKLHYFSDLAHLRAGIALFELGRLDDALKRASSGQFWIAKQARARHRIGPTSLTPNWLRRSATPPLQRCVAAHRGKQAALPPRRVADSRRDCSVGREGESGHLKSEGSISGLISYRPCKICRNPQSGECFAVRGGKKKKKKKKQRQTSDVFVPPIQRGARVELNRDRRKSHRLASHHASGANRLRHSGDVGAVRARVQQRQLHRQLRPRDPDTSSSSPTFAHTCASARESWRLP
jgi:hypothetical protein